MMKSNKLLVILLMAIFISSCKVKIKTDETEQSTYPYAPISSRIEMRPDGELPFELNAPTQVIVLGTGTPVPDVHRAGTSIAVIHKGQSYLFDMGSGTVRRALEARYRYNIPSLYPNHIKAVFITHLHSDHVMDLSELAATLWWRRPFQILAFGPKGLNEMSHHIALSMKADVDIRLNSVQPVFTEEGYKLDSTEIQPGIIYNENGISVEAFTVPHGDIKPAFGYKIVTEDMSIVISGDTAASEIVKEKAKGVDLLFHEVISDIGLAANTEFWQNYHKQAHTLASDVGKIAAVAKPKKLVLYHGLYYGTDEINVVNEAAKYFDGEIHLADDLDLFSAESK